MLLLSTLLVLLVSTALGYYFGGKQGAFGTFLTVLFLFGLPALMYVMQTASAEGSILSYQKGF